MANYGRGWEDGYGGQSAESMDAYRKREEDQSVAAQRSHIPKACQSTAFDAETECCLSCGKRH